MPRQIDAALPARYLRCDLHPSTDGVERVDILNMPFEDECFDAVIANHVMEHVDDDQRALREIYRVMRPGAWAILQTPYSPILEHTWADGGIRSEASRLQAFGQGDHVRLYGQDIFHRFESTGLRADIRHHDECMRDIDPDMYGVNRTEPLFLYRKPATPSSIGMPAP